MILDIYAESGYAPFEFVNEKGQPDGFNVDITKLIAEIMGFECRFHMQDWYEIIELSKSMSDEIIQGMFYSEERTQYVDFTMPFLEVSHSVFTTRENSAINQFEDIADKKIAVEEDAFTNLVLDSMYAYIEPSNVVRLKDHYQVLDELASGHVELVAGNRLTMQYIANLYYGSNFLKSVGSPISNGKMCYATGKKNTINKKLIEGGITKILGSKMYYQIYEKWFANTTDINFDYILTKVKAGIIKIDSLGKISSVNDSVLELFNISDCTGENIYYSKIIEFIGANNVQRILDGRDEVNLGTFTLKKSKRTVIINYSSIPILTSKKEIKGAVINFTDVTNEKELEKEIEKKEKMEFLERFTAKLAHEIRNPLTSIKNYIALLPDNIDDAEFRRSLLNNLPVQINLIDKLINELLTQSTPKDPVFSVINIKDTISFITDSLNVYGDYNIAIDISGAEVAYCDKNHFIQIFMNLVKNAIEACEIKKDIYITAFSEKDFVKIIVKNYGKQIDDSKLDKIFDPFYTTKEYGTGLGLAVSKQLVICNGGKINVISKEDSTNFIVKLPKKEL